MPQDASRATYAPKLNREDARLNWSLPAAEISRWIRGLDDVPGGWSLLNGEEPVKLYAPLLQRHLREGPRVEIRPGTPGEVIEVADGAGVLIGAGIEAVRIREVQPSGKRRMDAGEWIRGRGVKVGDWFV